MLQKLCTTVIGESLAGHPSNLRGLNMAHATIDEKHEQAAVRGYTGKVNVAVDYRDGIVQAVESVVQERQRNESAG